MSKASMMAIARREASHYVEKTSTCTRTAKSQPSINSSSNPRHHRLRKARYSMMRSRRSWTTKMHPLTIESSGMKMELRSNLWSPRKRRLKSYATLCPQR